jgi:hypothetical protein
LFFLFLFFLFLFCFFFGFGFFCFVFFSLFFFLYFLLVSLLIVCLFVCFLVGVASVRPWLCYIELMSYGDMLSIVKTAKFKQTRLFLSELLRVALQTADGMAYVAGHNWIHMDLAARNVLLGPGLVCKIADFGLTRKVNKKTRQYIQTDEMKLPIKWMAVEAIEQRVWSEASDVWSFGVIMWELFAYVSHASVFRNSRILVFLCMLGFRACSVFVHARRSCLSSRRSCMLVSHACLLLLGPLESVAIASVDMWQRAGCRNRTLANPTPTCHHRTPACMLCW